MTRAFRRSSVFASYRAALSSLAFDIAELIPGILLFTLIKPLESKMVWVIPLYPALLSVRGVINGIFSGRISTGLHLGTIKPQLMGNTDYLWNLYLSMVAITSLSGSVIGLLMSILYMNLEILFVVINTMLLSFLIVSHITLIVAFIGFKSGLDPDYFLYPIMSTLADILVTILYFFVISLYSLGKVSAQLMIFIVLIVLFVILFFKIKMYIYKNSVIEILLNMLFSVGVTSFIAFLTGVTLGTGISIMPPQMYAVYPALIGTIGGAGSILGSLSTTRLALGEVSGLRTYVTNRENAKEIVGIKLALLTMFTLYSMVVSIIRVKRFNVNILTTFVMFILVGAAAFGIIGAISLLIAFVSYRVGLDPDDFVNPFISTLADLVTTAVLVLFSYIMF